MQANKRTSDGESEKTSKAMEGQNDESRFLSRGFDCDLFTLWTWSRSNVR
jgi:hypothetical protein